MEVSPHRAGVEETRDTMCHFTSGFEGRLHGVFRAWRGTEKVGWCKESLGTGVNVVVFLFLASWLRQHAVFF